MAQALACWCSYSSVCPPVQSTGGLRRTIGFSAPSQMLAAIALCIPICGILLYLLMRWYESRRIGHICTGTQRRALFPPSVPMVPSARLVLEAVDLDVQGKLYTMKSGEVFFCRTMQSTTTPPAYILVFCHGYSSMGDMYLETVSHLARRGAIVVIPDLPCHGRSDGLLTYVPNWWSWVDHIWELLDVVVPPLRASGGKKQLRVFCTGFSLGGGLVTCVGVQRPTFFDGLALVAPMLGVSDEVKPPKIVQELFKGVFGPFKLRAPCAPSKDLSDFDFRIPEQGHVFEKVSPTSMKGLKPRLASATEFAFTYPDWIQSHFSELRVPFIVLHGREDRITELSQSQRLYDEASCKDKTIKLYDGAFHCELLSCLTGSASLVQPTWLPEQIRQTETCLKDIGDWLAERA